MERKLASVLFVDLVDSTGLVASSDPEVVRRRVNRFFERVSRSVATHGGIVEKFAGDAVMAAFGIPQAHEDDAERAVRAGLAILDSIRDLGLEARVGVESGEVVADDSESTFATGEAVNLAARLQQAAGPGEVYIGPAAHRLTLGRLETEELGPLDLRGHSEPVWAWRAICASDSGERQQTASHFVGREAELELLENTFGRAVRDRRAHLVTIYAEPGVGKSRLAREFVAGLESATVLFGRCLPYGEGITYWSLAEMVKSAAGISDDDPLPEAFEKLSKTCEDEAVADLLGLASGVLEAVQGDRSQQEIAWAAREWAEQLAMEQPLVLFFEDIHWAEEPLLELIEHLAAWVRESPLLLLCLARPELLDVRPAWGGGRLRAAMIELEPLAPEESEELADALVDGVALTTDVRAALLEKAEGNPLFLEETVRMMVESGDGMIERIPDTLQALIAARIDYLPAEEKALLQRAAVIGRTFWIGALAQLSPDIEELDPYLDDLILRNFLLSEVRSSISGERALRFKHGLIREVAFAGLAKSARADHHASFAAWLRERAGEELLEIRAYHLDHAATLLAELDGSAPEELRSEAASALTTAGERALAREANRAARKLLLRAVELESTLQRRYLAARAARRLADLPALSAEMEQVCADAQAAGERGLHGRALIGLAEVALLRDADYPKGLELAEKALDVLEEDDAPARFDALTTRATVARWTADLEAEERFSRDALALARAVGRKDLEATAAVNLAHAYCSRLEVESAAPLAERALELAEESGNIVARAVALGATAKIHQLRGELGEAEAAYEEARGLFAESGTAWSLAGTLNHLAWLARERGDLTRAERLFKDAIRILKPLEDRATLCESQRGLAEVLAVQGKLDEAERMALEARATVGEHDVTSIASTTMALGVVRAAQGRDDEAEDLLREAVVRLESTSCRGLQLEMLRSLDQFLRERGREEDAEPVARRLLELAPAAGIPTAFASSTARMA